MPQGEQPGRDPWGAICVEIPREREDELAGSLAWFSLGARLFPLGSERSLLKIYPGSPAQAAEAERLAVECLRAHGLDPAASAIRCEVVEDGFWVERYAAQLKPRRLGSLFMIHPVETGKTPPQLKPICLIPGRAFGTGEHATTQLCTEQLEQLVVPGSRWLDLGCGTAILSLVAAHCGASEVLGVDNDPEAIRVARTVLAENGEPPAVRVEEGSAAGRPGGRWDGVVANISAIYLLSDAAPIAELVKSAGLLVLSGFTVEQAEEVVHTYEQQGLLPVARADRDPWAVRVLRREQAVR